jgi:hypothetical protein
LIVRELDEGFWKFDASEHPSEERVHLKQCSREKVYARFDMGPEKRFVAVVRIVGKDVCLPKSDEAKDRGDDTTSCRQSETQDER